MTDLRSVRRRCRPCPTPKLRGIIVCCSSFYFCRVKHSRLESRVSSSVAGARRVRCRRRRRRAGWSTDDTLSAGRAPAATRRCYAVALMARRSYFWRILYYLRFEILSAVLHARRQRNRVLGSAFARSRTAGSAGGRLGLRGASGAPRVVPLQANNAHVKAPRSSLLASYVIRNGFV